MTYHKAIPQKILVSSYNFSERTIELSDFLEEINRWFPSIPDDFFFEVDAVTGLSVNVMRYETPEEASERVRRFQEQQRRVAEQANRSWEKQKKKFQKSRAT